MEGKREIVKIVGRRQEETREEEVGGWQRWAKWDKRGLRRVEEE